jgi:regulator of RNase E activity RraA
MPHAHCGRVPRKPLQAHSTDLTSTGASLVGESTKNIAETRGAAGYIIDGAIRDVASFQAADFPCFARAVRIDQRSREAL